ncbi:TetR/AcrR family transcriptional regulator [Paraliomyxa miuraensis]|uniref:TetR/AcrR family transcriptional regulator n=1 Tax=Paraliomyxa miuraensis TaxID=376150 RepID=UPI00225A7984|nr:TetR/AcrR family transcriptional regulator [Paraliomyxa miuraensis]MCX4246932.1 TetR/AcrR family transcriptional regulator [Paraliomyxa miuraensis]
MPRPRFERLPPERREAILDAAAAEVGEHGFARASYNRIIERAGLSKGAMYYYFDDKQDLYATVVEDAVARLFDALPSLPEVGGPAEFWASIESLTLSAWSSMLAQPRVSMLMPALLDPRVSAEAPELMAAVHERAATWIQGVLVRGREAGAVRDDLPDDLLLAVTLAVGEAIDRWVARRLLTASAGEADIGAAMGEAGEGPTPALVGTLVDLLRRVVAPA